MKKQIYRWEENKYFKEADNLFMVNFCLPWKQQKQLLN